MKKKQRGARFATIQEFQAGLSVGSIPDMRFDGCGIPLISTKDTLWVDDSGSHAIGIGSTGAGKSTLGAIPAIISMLACGESVIVTDLKGEIFQKTSATARKAGYKTIVLNFDRPARSNRWNPLSLPNEIYHKGGIENKDEASMLIYDIAYSICAVPDARERFWDLSSVDFTCGLIQGLIEDAAPEEVNMKSVALMGNMIEKRFAANTYLQEYFGLKPADSVAAMSASGTISAPSATRGSIVAVDRQAKRIFAASEGLSRMMAGMDFSYEDIAKEKTIVYLQYPGETGIYMPLVSCFVGQAYCALARIAKEQKDLRLPKRCNFVLDEFGNLTINEFPNRISMGRGYNMRFLLFVQDISQLKRKYSEEDMQTILSNCTTKVYYNVENYELKRRLSHECGMVQTITEHGATESHPLVAPYLLGMLHFQEALVFRRDVNFPFVTNLTPCFQMCLPEHGTPPQLPQMNEDIVPVFDLKEYVKAEKRRRLLAETEKEAKEASDEINLSEFPARARPELYPDTDFKRPSKKPDENIAASDKNPESGKVAPHGNDASASSIMSELDATNDDDWDDEDEYEIDDDLAEYEEEIWDTEDMAITICNDDVIELMRIDGAWDEAKARKGADFHTIAARAFLYGLESGELELSMLLQYVMQLPVYVDYIKVKCRVFDQMQANDDNLQRMTAYIDMQDDMDAYKALFERFALTKLQKRVILDRAKMALPIFDYNYLCVLSSCQKEEVE